MSKVPKTILELKADEAREYMLKGEQYCTFRMPEYFVFDKALALASTVIGRKDESQCYVSHTDENGKTKIDMPSGFDEINYLLYSNKDGKLDYRPLTLINPYYYYLLVRLITTPEAWKEITERFAALRDPHISVESVIVADDEYKERKTIINWWSRVEQQSIELSLQYKGAKGQVPVTRLVTCTSPSSTSSPQRCLWMKPRPIPVSLCSCRTVAPPFRSSLSA